MDYKVACSPLTHRIFAGKANNGMWRGEKVDVTENAIEAVAQHLIEKDIRVVFFYQGDQYEMKVERFG